MACDDGPARGREPGSGGAWVTVPSGDIHRVTHAAGAPAVTLHAYSPPLERVGTYALAEDGRLRRYPTAAETVLEPTR